MEKIISLPSHNMFSSQNLRFFNTLLAIVITLTNLNSAQAEQHNIGSQLTNANQGFAPKIVHQNQNMHLRLMQPQTLECVVEAQPEAEIKWFKDNQLIDNQMTHLTQMSSELTLLQVHEDDAGEYHCEATNMLGTVASNPFTLTVQSSDHDPNIRLEPAQAEINLDQRDSVEFSCSIPALSSLDSSSLESVEVRWKRNGRKLPLRWIEDELDWQSISLGQQQQSGSRFWAHKSAHTGEYLLRITRLQLKQDDNTNFTCLYNLNQSDGKLARESRSVRLRVFKMDVQLGAPIDNLSASKGPDQLGGDRIGRNQTLEQPKLTVWAQSLLAKLVADFYELIRPTLVVCSLLLIIGFLLAQFVLNFWRRKQRYQKHHQHHYSTGSGSSATSSVIGGSFDCDPVLKSLMGRTLSAPSAASLVGNLTSGNPNNVGAASKKYRSYRDHMRKVGVASNDIAPNDLVDGYLAAAAVAAQHQQPQGAQFAFGSNLPNLYNQSLAAREQSRSLLQGQQYEQHMRSLSNLSGSGSSFNNNNPRLWNNQASNGSHLNLPLGYAAFARSSQQTGNGATTLDDCSLFLSAGGLWQQQQTQAGGGRGRVDQSSGQQLGTNSKQDSEHYQLVNCASSHSPSSASSLMGSNHSSSSTRQAQQQKLQESSASNHYSTIETDEENDNANCQLLGPSSRQDRDFLVPASNLQNRLNESKRVKRPILHSNTSQDQLSPYAVSSICASLPQPPPINSEAMRALNEQFNINQLLLVDDKVMPFENPPPPPTNLDTKEMSKANGKRKSK